MPAVSADTVALPRIPAVDPTAADRPVLSVTTAPSGFEGEGFPVRRAFAGVDLRALDPVEERSCQHHGRRSPRGGCADCPA